jgi:ornithine carbamoyltransferase
VVQKPADVFTLSERFGELPGLKLAFIGDGNNVAHSLMYAGAKLGAHVVIATPPGYAPDPAVVSRAREDAASTGGSITVGGDPAAAVASAEVVYTDTWTSMGQEEEAAWRRVAFAGFTVDAAMLSVAGPDAVFMHCLPAHRGEEVTDEVIDGPQSVVVEQAENRLHLQKALMAMLVKSSLEARPSSNGVLALGATVATPGA